MRISAPVLAILIIAAIVYSLLPIMRNAFPQKLRSDKIEIVRCPKVGAKNYNIGGKKSGKK